MALLPYCHQETLGTGDWDSSRDDAVGGLLYFVEGFFELGFDFLDLVDLFGEVLHFKQVQLLKIWDLFERFFVAEFHK